MPQALRNSWGGRKKRGGREHCSQARGRPHQARHAGNELLHRFGGQVVDQAWDQGRTSRQAGRSAGELAWGWPTLGRAHVQGDRCKRGCHMCGIPMQVGCAKLAELPAPLGTCPAGASLLARPPAPPRPAAPTLAGEESLLVGVEGRALQRLGQRHLQGHEGGGARRASWAPSAMVIARGVVCGGLLAS